MHVFLTGEIQVGKSTIIKKLLDATGLRADGFKTYWRPSEDGGQDLYIRPFGIPGENSMVYHVAHRSERTLVVHEPVFDSEGVRILESSGQYPLIIMDELGFMESHAASFQRSVLRLLDGDIQIVGVIKPRSIPFLDAVRAHPNVRTELVTPENRQEVFEKLLANYTERGEF